MSAVGRKGDVGATWCYLPAQAASPNSYALQPALPQLPLPLPPSWHPDSTAVDAPALPVSYVQA